jgi:hypothetical protein
LIATGPLSVVDPTVAVMRSAGRLIVDPRMHAGEIARFTSHVTSHASEEWVNHASGGMACANPLTSSRFQTANPVT